MSQLAIKFDTEPEPTPELPARDDSVVPNPPRNIPPVHAEAMRAPLQGFESAIVKLYGGLAEYAEAHAKQFGSVIATDYVIGESWEQLGQGLLGLLNAETGRFCCATLDWQIRKLIESGGTEQAIREVREVLAPPPPPRGRRGKPEEIKIGARALSDRQRELLNNLRVENNVAIYVPDSIIPDWDELKRVMVALGGEWKKGRKGGKGGFHFPDDADARELVRLALETGEILDPKAAEFFETPTELADDLAAFIDAGPGDVVLEPSAGKGALASAVLRRCPDAKIVCIEPFPENAKALRSMGFEPIKRDFLELSPGDIGPISHCIMNPPFSGRQDVAHVTRALSLLPVGGRLAAIASAGVQYRDDRVGRDFRSLLERHRGRIVDNPDGSFASAGTMVRTVSIFVEKRS